MPTDDEQTLTDMQLLDDRYGRDLEAWHSRADDLLLVCLMMDHEPDRAINVAIKELLVELGYAP